MKRNGADRKPHRSSQGRNDLKPLLALMSKLATRMDRLDKKMDSMRKETIREFKKSDSFRKETAQKFEKSRKENFSFRKEMKQEIQSVRKDMRQNIGSVRDDVAKYYLMARDGSRIIADEHARTLTKNYTTMDHMAKDYSRWLIEKQYNDVELERHSREIKELAEKDTEKDMRLQNLQKRVAVLENTKHGGAATFQPEPQLTA
jgi:hypothetical protein